MSNHPEYDAGNRRHVEKRKKASKAVERRLDEAVRWLMADARGRQVMWHWLSAAHVFRSSMAATPELTAFNEGQRSLGLVELERLQRLCPEQYLRMTAEARAGTPAPDLDSDPTPTGDDDDDNRNEE